MIYGYEPDLDEPDPPVCSGNCEDCEATRGDDICALMTEVLRE